MLVGKDFKVVAAVVKKEILQIMVEMGQGVVEKQALLERVEVMA